MRDDICRDGHAFVVRSVRGHDEWYCERCNRCGPDVRTLLRLYVKQHGGTVRPW
jgi:hypothetical protein